jgi:O-antigen/teichoic acid export membrane protein
MTAEAEQTEANTKGGSAPAVPASMPATVAKNLIGGTSALGLGIMFERGLGFVANLLAARLGGASTFGAYSLAITTANNISSYAAGGIGSTAIRFSGKYQRDSAGYATLSRVLLIISVVSAGIAACGLWAGATPIAHLLGKESLKSLLQWAALSAAGMILLECCRGFLVGQRRLMAILMLSSVVGIGMICLLPAASRVGPVRMISTQGGITLGAVLLCLLLYKPLGLAATSKAGVSEPLGPMLRSVWSFGMIQLAGLVGMNAAGWWLTSLVARADASMVQMGFFAIAHQLRNMVALAPSLLTESGLAVMAHGEQDRQYAPDQVMAACTFATTFASLLLAGLGIVIVPWALTALYGKSYAAASAATAVALATAVIHMGSGPASARLSIVSIRLAGVINTVWAIAVAGSATLVFLWGRNAPGSSAWKGASIYLAAHLMSAGLVFLALTRKKCVPSGMNATFLVGTTVVLLLTGLAFWRNIQPAWTLAISLLMLALCFAALAVLLRIGNHYRWVPSLAGLKRMLRGKGLLPSLSVETSTSGGFDA